MGTFTKIYYTSNFIRIYKTNQFALGIRRIEYGNSKGIGLSIGKFYICIG